MKHSKTFLFLLSAAIYLVACTSATTDPVTAPLDVESTGVSGETISVVICTDETWSEDSTMMAAFAQEVGPTGSLEIEGALPIWGHEVAPDSFVTLLRIVQLPADMASVSGSITFAADDRAEVLINSVELGVFDAASSAAPLTFAVVNLHGGQNIIRAVVSNLADGAWFAACLTVQYQQP